jgi:hypothetical protein
MIDDCFDLARQQKFMKGLEEFKENTQKKSGKVFSENSLVEKTSILKEMQFFQIRHIPKRSWHWTTKVILVKIEYF